MEMKPCPFCGGAAQLSQTFSYKTKLYFVFCGCMICGGKSKSYPAHIPPADHDWDTDETNAAIQAWNMRRNEGSDHEDG